MTVSLQFNLNDSRVANPPHRNASIVKPMLGIFNAKPNTAMLSKCSLFVVLLIVAAFFNAIFLSKKKIYIAMKPSTSLPSVVHDFKQSSPSFYSFIIFLFNNLSPRDLIQQESSVFLALHQQPTLLPKALQPVRADHGANPAPEARGNCTD